MGGQGYSETVRALFFDPAGAGSFPEEAEGIVTGRAGSREQGAQVQIQLRLEGRRIVEARYLAWGCPVTIAAAAWLVQELAGSDLDEAAAVRGLDVMAALDAPAEKLGALLVVEDALGACLESAGASPNT